jgi:hypothetical protein
MRWVRADHRLAWSAAASPFGEIIMGVSGCQRRAGGGAPFPPESLSGKQPFTLSVADGGLPPGLPDGWVGRLPRGRAR